MELRITSLENSQATASRDIENLKTSTNAAAKKHLEFTESLKNQQKETKQAFANLQKENEAFQAKLTELEDKNLYLEAYSRRENLKFENIVEEYDGREETESVLRDFLETELGLEDASTVEIQRVHRLGKKNDDKPRPIIARFLRYKDCERILSRGNRLRGSDFKMYQDLPYEIVARRRKQMDTFKKARKNNIPASFSKAQPDKLFIRGKFWPSGRFIVCDIKAKKKNLTLANIYAPNDDNPAFFSDFFDHLADFKSEEIVIGGDFNLVLDLEKDKIGGLPKTHQNSVKIIHEFSENLDLVDAWRLLHPETNRYTWRQRHPKVQCRLDFFLVSQSIANSTTHAEISPGYKSDHSMITLKISIHSNPRGPGFWKLNTSFLTETTYVNQIKATIKETLDEYSEDNSVRPTLLWEMVKLKVREKSLLYAKTKKKQTKEREIDLEQSIAKLEEEADKRNLDDVQTSHIEEEIDKQKRELEKIIEERTKGAILRSKTKWYNEGEKNTKYFLNLEKRHYKQSAISQIKISENQFVTSNEEIGNECVSFFKSLYESRCMADELLDTSVFFDGENDTILTDHEREACEGPVTKKECLDALKTMESEKTPGTDGLPAEFYKIFWNDISTTLINALNFAYDTGQLSITQRRGIIKLIPKKDAEPYLIKNWRPLTLLNCDYKLAAKAIANRIKKYLPNVINNDQTGFIKGRFIGENIRLIDSIIRYAKEKNMPGLLLFLDFEKAFDTVEWPFIRKTLEYFGFGTAEVLAKAIRKNRNIKGILVKNKEIKLSQYADDTTLVLNGSRESLLNCLQTLDDFYKVSGLKLNDKKTEALWIGSKCGSSEILLPGRNFKWPKNKVKALGVWLSIDAKETAALNYNEKLEKVRTVLSCWKYRRLTLMGKITVLKSLVASQLVYVLSPLPSNEKVIKEVNKLFFSFLWNGKPDRIKRNVIINDYPSGGLRMIDIESFSKSLKASWVKKYLDEENHGKWKLFFDVELDKNGGPIVLKGNLNTKDIKKFQIKDTFIKEVLTIWSDVNFEDEIKSENQFLNQNLWHNSVIRIDDRPVFYSECYHKGITKVKHLKDGSNNFLSYFELQTKFSLKICPLRYYGLISALKLLWDAHKNNLIMTDSEYETFSETLIKSQRTSPPVYQKLISKKSTLSSQSQRKWFEDCNTEETKCIKWSDAYQLAFKCTKSTKLIEFQFKLLHRRISTNEFLTKIGVQDDPNCSFCKEEPEKLKHLFWSCSKVTSFWNSLTELLKLSKIFPEHYTVNISVALGLIPDCSKNHRQINFCFLLARHFIWICKNKTRPPKIESFLLYLKSIYVVEQRTDDTTNKKWDLLESLLKKK
ncbi:hypothetical protein ACROYT_G010777 [Oculina patagonica]